MELELKQNEHFTSFLNKIISIILNNKLLVNPSIIFFHLLFEEGWHIFEVNFSNHFVELFNKPLCWIHYMEEYHLKGLGSRAAQMLAVAQVTG